MSQEYPRRYRVADQIQRELGDLMRGVKDPRVTGLITVSGVDVSPDLRNASVFVSMLQDAEPDSVIAGLNAASGYLRSELARRLTLRSVPRLRFLHDATPEQADRVTRLLRDALDDRK